MWPKYGAHLPRSPCTGSTPCSPVCVLKCVCARACVLCTDPSLSLSRARSTLRRASLASGTRPVSNSGAPYTRQQPSLVKPARRQRMLPLHTRRRRTQLRRDRRILSAPCPTPASLWLYLPLSLSVPFSGCVCLCLSVSQRLCHCGRPHVPAWYGLTARVSQVQTPAIYGNAVATPSAPLASAPGFPAHAATGGAATGGGAAAPPMEAPQDFTCPITQEIMVGPTAPSPSLNPSPPLSLIRLSAACAYSRTR